MIQLSDAERKALSSLGRSEHGRELVVILSRLKNEMSSINSIDGAGDYGAQVEGRKLFASLIDAIVKAVEQQKRTPRALDQDDYT